MNNQFSRSQISEDEENLNGNHETAGVIRSSSGLGRWCMVLGCLLLVVMVLGYIWMTVNLLKSVSQSEKLIQTILDETTVIQKKQFHFNKRTEEQFNLLTNHLQKMQKSIQQLDPNQTQSLAQNQTQPKHSKYPITQHFEEHDEDLQAYGINGLTAQDLLNGQYRSQGLRIIDMLAKNDQGYTIQQYLYRNDEIIEQRKINHQQRIDFLASKRSEPTSELIQFNMKLNTERDAYENETLKANYQRLAIKYNLQDYPTELPMCIINPGYNNNANFRIEYGLNSIFTQNYTNYFVVVINDGSNDGSDQIYDRYFEFHKISKSKYIYINNRVRLTALENIYNSFTRFCSKDSIALTLDADDEFIGRNVLKVFNAVYQKQRAGIVYSSYYWYAQASEHLRHGYNTEYTQQQKKNNTFRKYPTKFSQLRSFRVELSLHIDRNDLLDKDGNFQTITYDWLMFYPMMEFSCGRVKWVDEYMYLYNIETGMNDYQRETQRQLKVGDYVKALPPKQCWKQFDQKMNNL